MEIKVEVKFKNSKHTESIVLDEKESLYDALVREGYLLQSSCGGNGRCGKCKVLVCKGNVPITMNDKLVFSQKELKDGWRLACRIIPDEDMAIVIDSSNDSEFDVVSEYNKDSVLTEKLEVGQKGKYNITIDLGTTTLVFQLIEKTSGTILHTVTRLNSQRTFGADVISRIQASVNGKRNELQSCIRNDLQYGIKELLTACNVEFGQVENIVLAGNTTMIHLLKGYDCSGLGAYPFSPVNVGMQYEKTTDLLDCRQKNICENDITILPGISAFVGGDIVSGLYANGFSNSEDICLMIDLGTNGEMALGNRDKILVTSTAAGPAFEGGNILWGTGSVAGAICSVDINGETIAIKTIQDKAPCGICGTGVIETVSELLKNKIIDETGLLVNDYFDEGYPIAYTEDGRQIVFTQKDIRELQLAKAAIRAGIELLLLRYGITAAQVAKVYLAGGFGYRLDIHKAVLIGMLPEELCNRIETVGNSALKGAAMYSQNKHNNELYKIISASKEIILAKEADFNTFYLDAMMFEKK